MKCLDENLPICSPAVRLLRCKRKPGPRSSDRLEVRARAGVTTPVRGFS